MDGAGFGTHPPNVIVADRPLRPSVPLPPGADPLFLVYVNTRTGQIDVALWGAYSLDLTPHEAERILEEAKVKAVRVLRRRRERSG